MRSSGPGCVSWACSSGPRDPRRLTGPGLARPSLSAGIDLGRFRHQLLGLLRGRRRGRPVPLRRRRRRDPRSAAGVHRLGVARLPARRRTGHALRVPCARRTTRAGRPAVRGAAPPRPLRAGRDRRHRVERRDRERDDGLRLRRHGSRRRRCDRSPIGGVRPGRVWRGRHRALRSSFGGGEPLVRLGRGPQACDTVAPHRALRGARQGSHDAPPRRSRGAARHLPGPVRPTGDRPPARARRHRGRAHADAPVRPRPPSRRARSEELLGIQLDRLLRPAQRVLRGPRRAASRCRSSR